MKEYDTGTIRNTVVEMAASIMTAKVEYMHCVADQFAEKGQTERADVWRADAKRIEEAVATMNTFMGAWS